jgi:peptide/nickel transport system substrate-binding protein
MTIQRLSRRDALKAAAAGATVLSLPDFALAQAQQPKRGGRVVYGQTYPNWALGDSNRGQHAFYWIDLMTRSAWNCLCWVDEELRVQPEIATSWETDDAVRVWEFTIRENVTFHDGRPMTIADVVQSCAFHASIPGFVARQVEKVEQAGPNKVRFLLKAPNAEFPYTMADYRNVIMPAAPFDQIGFDGIGTGPFKIVDVDNKRIARMVRHEQYWVPGRPYLDELHGVLATGQAAINGFRSGQLNAVFNIDPGQVQQFRAAGGEVQVSSAGDQFWLVIPKNLDQPWADVRVRQAMALAIDRKAINRIVYGVADGWTGNDTHISGNDPVFVPRAVERDVARARALLAEAGHPNGIELPVMYFTASFPEEPRIFPIVTESLRAAGITLRFEERPQDGFNQFNLAVNSPIGRPRRSLVGPRNAAISLQRLTSANPGEQGGWTGPAADRYDALYAQAVATKDEARRFEMYREMQRLAQSEAPGIMLGGRRNMAAFRPDVRNLRSHPQNWGSRFDEIWIA